MMKNKRIPQKQKPYGRDKKYKTNKEQKKKVLKIVDEKILLNRSYKSLEKKEIYLLELKMVSLSNKDIHIYAVIFKKQNNKNPNISHEDCIIATKHIQENIKKEGFDEGDYAITVSSAGFRWIFDSNYELFVNMPIKIRYKNENEESITVKTIMKDAKEDYIVIGNDELENIKILKKDIIKARLNN